MNVMPNKRGGTCSFLRGMRDPCVGMILPCLCALEPSSVGSSWYVNVEPHMVWKGCCWEGRLL